MPGEATDPEALRYEQYGDRVDNPERRPGEYFSLLHIVRFREYRVTTLNLPGPYPRMQGEAPFADPYGYRWEHLDEWGRLGKFEWTARTQYLSPSHPFPIHRAFIPLNVKQFEFDPRAHLVQARGPNPGLRSLTYKFLDNARNTGLLLVRSIRRINRMTSRHGFELPSKHDPDWHFGMSWMQLLVQGSTPAPAWKIVHTAEEIRRRLMDGTGYVTMAFRVLLYLWCYKERLALPKFRTTTKLAGVIVNRNDEYSDMVSKGLAELGVPVWELRVCNDPAPMETYPKGSTRYSPLWTESEAEVRRRNPYLDRRSQQGTQLVREAFEEKVQEQLDNRVATGPEDVWIPVHDQPASALLPGPLYRYHEAYYRKPQGPPDELYLEGIIRWITSVQEGNYMTNLLEIQEVLGKNTLPLTRRDEFPPMLPLLHENYPLCRKWAEDAGHTWREPGPVPRPPAPSSLQARLIDPDTRTYGAAPALYERMSGLDPLYPSVPRSARRRQEFSGRRRLQPESDGGDDLEPYEAPESREPDETFETREPATLSVDYTLPLEMVEASPPGELDMPEEEEGPESAWDAQGERSDRFPVELAPFVYLGRPEDLEDELMERYGSGVKEWLYEEPRLVLVFAERDRAARAIKNQRLAAQSYPSESPARAISYSEGAFRPWSPEARIRAINGMESRRRERQAKFPTPAPVLVRGGKTRPPGTEFTPRSLAELLHPGGLPSAAGSPLTLMSRYFASAAVLSFFLNERITRLTTYSTTNANSWRAAAQHLRHQLSCHLSYEKPTGFTIPIPFAGPFRDTLIWLAQELPAVEPTSVSARGTYTSEAFRWNPIYERFEIIIDDLQLEDYGLLTSDD
jgi:hypothetical protein